MAKQLTDKQQRFVDEYLIDPNGTRAYMAAYPSVKKPETAKASAARLLTNANISEALRKGQEKRAARVEITQDRVLMEYARLAFVDPRKFYNPDGTLKSIVDLDDDTAACLAGMDVSTNLSEEHGINETIRKIKLTDKKGALDSVARHLGMFDKDRSGGEQIIFNNINFGKKS